MSHSIVQGGPTIPTMIRTPLIAAETASFTRWDVLTQDERRSCINLDAGWHTHLYGSYLIDSVWCPKGRLQRKWNEKILDRVLKSLDSEEIKSILDNRRRLTGRSRRPLTDLHIPAVNLWIMSGSTSPDVAHPCVTFSVYDYDIASRVADRLRDLLNEYISDLKVLPHTTPCFVTALPPPGSQSRDEESRSFGSSWKRLFNHPIWITRDGERPESGVRATMGCIFHVDGIFYGTTSAHALRTLAREADLHSKGPQHDTDSPNDVPRTSEEGNLALLMNDFSVYIQEHIEDDEGRIDKNGAPMTIVRFLRIGRGISTGNSKPRASYNVDLDWALFLVIHPKYKCSSRIKSPETDRWMDLAVAADDRSVVDGLVAKHSSTGSLSRGHMNGTLSAIKLPGSKQYLKAHTVIGECDRGDSGSLYVIPGTGHIVGCAVAASTEENLAYCSRASEVFGSIVSNWDCPSEAVLELFSDGGLSTTDYNHPTLPITSYVDNYETQSAGKQLAAWETSTSSRMTHAAQGTDIKAPGRKESTKESTLAKNTSVCEKNLKGKSEVQDFHSSALKCNSDKAMSKSNFDPRSAIGRFFATLGQLTQTTDDGRQYMRTKSLEQWVEHEMTALLAQAHTQSQSLPEPQEIRAADSRSVILFSILLELGRPDLLRPFMRYKLTDSRLPLHLSYLQQVIKGNADGLVVGESDALANKFHMRQFDYFPVIFKLDMNVDLSDGQILPICRREILDVGGTARVWRIVVQREFVEQELQGLVPNSLFRDKDHGWCYQFAVKAFHEKHRGLYESDQALYKALSDHHGFLRCFGGFTQKSLQTSVTDERSGKLDPWYDSTRYLLLEYGELDLDEYFAEVQPPVLKSELYAFWEALIRVVNGFITLPKFVQMREDTKEYHVELFPDIKPNNILNVQGEFKLIDPGFVRHRQPYDTEEESVPGTDAYNPPEWCDLAGLGLSAKESIDVWSVGCLLSIAATWIVLGNEGIKQYIGVRQQAIDDVIDSQARLPMAVRQTQAYIHKGDRFHDGVEVLPAIRQWHTFLRGASRKADDITAVVLDLIDEHALRGFSQDRLPGLELIEKLNTILKASGKGQATFPLGSSSLRVLLHADERARIPGELQQRQYVVPKKLNRKARRMYLLNQPSVKISHRAQVLKAVPEGFPQRSSVAISTDDPSFTLSRPPRPNSALAPEVVDDSPRDTFQCPASSSKREDQQIVTAIARQKSVSASVKSTSPKVIPPSIDNSYHDRERIQTEGGPSMDQVLKEFFNNCITHLLIDNGASMNECWGQTRETVTKIAKACLKYHMYGMDLSFTNSDINLRNCKTPASFAIAMQQAAVSPGNKNSDVARSLAEIINPYLQVYSETLTITKTLTIIVLTDGLWRGMQHQDGVANEITRLSNELAKCFRRRQEDPRIRQTSLPEFPVRIQFVYFGEDPGALVHLEHLETLGLKLMGGNVGLEFFNGDVYRMISGSSLEEIEKAPVRARGRLNSQPNVDETSSRLQQVPVRAATVSAREKQVVTQPSRHASVSGQASQSDHSGRLSQSSQSGQIQGVVPVSRPAATSPIYDPHKWTASPDGQPPVDTPVSPAGSTPEGYNPQPRPAPGPGSGPGPAPRPGPSWSAPPYQGHPASPLGPGPGPGPGPGSGPRPGWGGPGYFPPQPGTPGWAPGPFQPYPVVVPVPGLPWSATPYALPPNIGMQRPPGPSQPEDRLQRGYRFIRDHFT